MFLGGGYCNTIQWLMYNPRLDFGVILRLQPTIIAKMDSLWLNTGMVRILDNHDYGGYSIIVFNADCPIKITATVRMA